MKNLLKTIIAVSVMALGLKAQPVPPTPSTTTLTINSAGTVIDGLTIGSGLNLSGGVLTVTAGGGNVSTSGSITAGLTAQWASATTIQAVANTGTGNYVLSSSPTITTPTFVGVLTFPTNTRQTFAPGSTVAGFNVGSVAANPATPTNGDMWYNSASNLMYAQVNGASVSIGAGLTNPMTTTGDIIYASLGSTPGRLAIGATGNVLTVSGGVPVWSAPPGGGNVSNTGTPTSGQIGVWTNATTLSGVTNLTVPGTLTVSGSGAVNLGSGTTTVGNLSVTGTSTLTGNVTVGNGSSGGIVVLNAPVNALLSFQVASAQQGYIESNATGGLVWSSNGISYFYTNNGSLALTLDTSQHILGASTTDSTSITTGSMQLAGGLGVSKTTTALHYAGGSGTPGIVVNGNAGSGASASLVGNDTGGEITVVCGATGTSLGTLCTVTFATAYTTAPKSVVLGYHYTAGAGVWTVCSYNISTTGFSVYSPTTGFAGATLIWDYHVL